MSDSQELIGDRYRLLEHIGQGGMGTVWRARDEVLGRAVAVKEVIPSPDLTGPEREVFTVRTLREARAAGRIGHPGVATVYDVIEERGRPWIVMQLVDSRTLGAVIREDGPLPPAEAARIGLDVLGALVAAHRVGVLHRDVKPDNVLLATDGRAVLTDFGIAVLEGDSSVTRTGALIGTPAFIAPERAHGGPAEFASDLWSLGVTLYMAVEGHSPFQRAHPLATLAAVMHEAPAPLRFAGTMGPVVSGLLRKDPARRMSAEEVQAHLAAIVAGIAPEPTMPTDLAALSPVPAAAAVNAPGGPGGGPPAAGARELPPAGPGGGAPGAAGAVAGAAAPGSRRRPLLAAAAATAFAVALTAGGMAWITSKSGGTVPAGPSASSVSVPSTGPAEPEDREGTGTTVDTGDPPADTGGSRPSARPTSDGRTEDAPDSSGGPSEKPSPDGSGDGSDQDSGNGSGDGSDQDSGNGSGDDPEQDTDQGSGDGGDPPGQVEPGSGLNASGPGASGRGKPGKGTTGKPGKASKETKRRGKA
ncbi:serine/threonine-protein kinase [Planomonospora venezuelensis]|uniref:non-specific serine/threonine protein kinase n=1 Tax=Planomonospora venezuelensis TaxID=1999 RepID=A0A841D7B4_PLAVE|nr:serine/threonine-protein kinase [Planomonospora venezuelensis]MBB5964803.1 hypothetical protein [Planomonospora venezuelensis]GIM99290.1 hypothetical protein Pve01_09490 [Planomonospora venezuelensis]